MNRETVISTTIASIGYSSATHQLEVEFQTGAIYLYYNVPQGIFNQIMNANSIGSAFHYLIKESDYSYDKIK